MQLTATSLHNAIGKHAVYPINGLLIDVRIIDAKMSWGQPRLLIKPNGGSGQVWVDFNSLRPESGLSLIAA